MPDQPSPTPDAVAPTARARSARLIPLLLVGAMLLPTTACTPEHMIDLINAERTAAGVGQLTPDASLAASCQSWAEHLAALSPPQLIHQNLRALYREATNAQGMARSAHRKGAEGRDG